MPREKPTRFDFFPSNANLTERILRFIEYYNTTMAKPYRWAFTGFAFDLPSAASCSHNVTLSWCTATMGIAFIHDEIVERSSRQLLTAKFRNRELI
ncbi:hypothetical protein LOC67_16280 [Stieleria sp. JC731]|uniref:hypothetical protein n=1 Tax=Pirellulaceae TaxID=2691357 RepID=UPI001E28C3FA|nr:hypothetical protein [Stieleria sp. JC731]MCC9602120.1 hypothetical protein [Stieleria sp. JC731]